MKDERHKTLMSLHYAVPWYSIPRLVGQLAKVCSNKEDAQVGTLLEITGIWANLITGGTGLFVVTFIIILSQFPCGPVLIA